MRKKVVFTKGDSFHYVGELVQSLKEHKCKLLDCQLLYLTGNQVAEHYPLIVDKPFYPQVAAIYEVYPVFVLCVKGRLKNIRKVTGLFTDPAKCAPGSFRKKHGIDIGNNACHRTGSIWECWREVRRFFGKKFWFFGKDGFVTLYRRNPEQWLVDIDRIMKLVHE